MKKVFMINETVIFEPELRRLGPLANYPERAVALHGPVSECLTQLLEHNGQVLSQRYLFSAVWEKQGAVVTTNALYQTISSIRKALKAAGLADDVIKTISKEGFKSIARVVVGEREDFLNPQSMPANPIFVASSSAPPETNAMPHTAPRKHAIVYGLAALLFILSCYVLYLTWTYDEPAYANYYNAGQMNGCHIFSSWHDRDKSRSAFETLSGRYPVKCNQGEIAYLTLNHAQRGVSVLVCDKNPQESSAHCHSIYYKQQYHENE